MRILDTNERKQGFGTLIRDEAMICMMENIDLWRSQMGDFNFFIFVGWNILKNRGSFFLQFFG